MDQLRRVLATIVTYLGQMNTTQRLLIGSLCVIVVMMLFVVTQYAGRSDLTEVVPGAPIAEQQKIVPILDAAGIKHSSPRGIVLVASADRRLAQAKVAESGRMPADTALLFQNILEKQSWQMSRQQNEQLYAIALQNELSSIISHFSSIERATVILDVPERQGLGQAVLRPTASATVFMKGGKSLDQGTVDAVAHLIAGARAGLAVDNVRVIDGTSGRQRKPSSETDALATTYLEQAARVESQMQAKLMELFAYIPGRIIAVTAQVDVTRSKAQVTEHFEKGKGTVSLPRKTSEQTSTSTESSPAAEPGLSSNIGADINRASRGPGNKTETTTDEREMDNLVGKRVQEIVDPKGMPTMLAVSVHVPRAYVAGLIKQAAPADPAAKPTEPTEEAIDAKFDKSVKPELIKSILPHIRAMTTEAGKSTDAAALTKLLESQIAVSLMPLDIGPMTGGGSVGTGAGDGGLGGAGGGLLALGVGMFDKVILGVLALISLGMMVAMVRRAARKGELPTAEELVGLPPKLQTHSDMMGEADETDTPLAGIEVGEAEMAATKMLEQVNQLVKASPESSAKLLNRWISVES